MLARTKKDDVRSESKQMRVQRNKIGICGETKVDWGQQG